MATHSINIDRHCSYCLKSVPSGTAVLCQQCNRRAYCSQGCQQKDWKLEIGSQGHKNWCHLQYGEQDLDWEIRPVPGKGMGVVAKRVIPSKYRIMVDAICANDHPAINELHGDTLEEKLHLNRMECTRGQDDFVVCLHIARCNHNCHQNAGYYYDDSFKVMILYAEREIQIGEEIAINYYSFRRQNPYKCREILDITWGIKCERNCFCWNEEICQMAKVYARLEIDFQNVESWREFIGLNLDSVEQAMINVRERLKLHDQIRAQLYLKIDLLMEGFENGIMRQATLEEALDYAKQALEIKQAFLHPYSAELVRLKRSMDDPSTHKNYLVADNLCMNGIIE